MTTQTPVTKEFIYVVDDDSDLREAVASLLRSLGFEVMSFHSAESFLEHVRNPADRCCVLSDVHMPGMTGIELQHEMAARGLHCPVILMSAHGTVRMVVAAMQEGAVDFLAKPFTDVELLSAVRKALKQDRDWLQAQDERDVVEKKYLSLTPRERAVVPYLLSGKANKVIAFEMGIREVTVKVHRGAVVRKMGVSSMQDLVRTIQKIEPLKK